MLQQYFGGPALRWGLIFGVVAGVVGVLDVALPYVVKAPTAQDVGGFIAFAIFLVIYFLAGWLATRDTGKVSAGTIAGLVAAAIGELIGGLVGIGLIAASPRAYALVNGESLNTQASVLLTVAIMGILMGVLIYATFGAGLGALGGLLAQARHARPAQSSQAGQ
jgi:hypothetical protein